MRSIGSATFVTGPSTSRRIDLYPIIRAVLVIPTTDGAREERAPLHVNRKEPTVLSPPTAASVSAPCVLRIATAEAQFFPHRRYMGIRTTAASLGPAACLPRGPAVYEVYGDPSMLMTYVFLRQPPLDGFFDAEKAAHLLAYPRGTSPEDGQQRRPAIGDLGNFLISCR